MFVCCGGVAANARIDDRLGWLGCGRGRRRGLLLARNRGHANRRGEECQAGLVVPLAAGLLEFHAYPPYVSSPPSLVAPGTAAVTMRWQVRGECNRFG